jgi:hypothetical protein
LTSSNSQRSTPLHAIAGILPDKPSNAPRKISSGFEAPDRLRQQHIKGVSIAQKN